MSFARTEPAWPALIVAGALSLAAHAAVLAGFAGRGESLMIEGGGVAEIAALGNDFRDFTRGALPSQAAEAVPETPTEAAPTPSPVAPRATASDTPPAATEAAEAPTTPPVAASRTLTETAPEAAPPASETPAVTAAPAATSVASTPATPPAATQVTPLAAAAPVTPPTTAPTPEVEVQMAAADTPRPQRRPDPETRRPPQQSSAAQAAGDSDRDARRGSDHGQQQATAARAAPRQAAAAAPGNAAASNYPGQVMQRIQRVRRARVNARGTAVVAFTIAPGGGLAGVQIARASGSAALDQAALDHIRRAAPFPAPPQGAQRQFSFEFVGR